MVEPLSQGTEDTPIVEPLSAENSLKRLQNGWYYRYGTPEDLPFLTDTMLDRSSAACYSAAQSILSIEACHGLNISEEAVLCIQDINDQCVRANNTSEDFSNYLPLFLQACYIGAPQPTLESVRILEQFDTLVEPSNKMNYGIIEYIVTSGKPIEGVCAQYLLENGARGLLQEFVRAWQYDGADLEMVDPVLIEATSRHFHTQIHPGYYTEEFELAVSTAMGFGVDLPDFMLPFIEEHPEICLQNFDSFDRKLVDLEGKKLEYPKDAVDEIFEKGIEAFPPLLQPVYRRLVSEGTLRSRHMAHSFPSIIQAMKEGRELHPDVWALMQLSHGQELFNNFNRQFARVEGIPLELFIKALSQEDRYLADLPPEKAQRYQTAIQALDNIFDGLPDDLLRIAFDAPINLPEYLDSYLTANRKLVNLCSVYLKQRLGVSDEDYQQRMDQQLLALVDDNLNPKIVSEFLRSISRGIDKYIVRDEKGALKVTREGIDIYLMGFQYEGNPAPLRETGLLPDDLSTAREFALLFPKNQGKGILEELGIIHTKRNTDNTEMTIDDEKFGRYIKGKYPNYALTTEGIREWVFEERAKKGDAFSLDLFISNGLFTVDQLQDFNFEDPLDFEIILEFASDIRSEESKLGVARYFAKALTKDLDATDNDIETFSALLFEWMFKTYDPDEIKKLFDKDTSPFMTMDKSTRLRRAKEIVKFFGSTPSLRNIFPKSELSKLLSIDLSPKVINEIKTFSQVRCAEERECFEFMILETAGSQEFEGAHEWYTSLTQLAEKMFSDDSFMSRAKLWIFLKSRYPLSEAKNIEIPTDNRELLWEYLAEDPDAFLRYGEFSRDDWKNLLGTKTFQEFLAALPLISTFDNSPLRRNAFTGSNYDKVLPFIEFLVDNCEIKLSPAEFELMKEYIARYGLSQNIILYRMYRWVCTRQEGEVHPDFPGIESLEDIDRVLREVRDQITSSEPIKKLPDDSLKKALFAHELGYTGHTFYKPEFDQLYAEFEANGKEITIPEGHKAFDVQTRAVTRESEISVENARLLKELLDEVWILKNPAFTQSKSSIDYVKSQSITCIESMIISLEQDFPLEAPEETFVKTRAKILGLLEKAQDIKTPEDVVTIFTSTQFEHQYDEVVNRILRSAAILQYISKNSDTSRIARSRDGSVSPEDLDTLYKLIVSGTYNHTLAIQEFPERLAKVITTDWDPGLLKPSIMRRLRKALKPAVTAVTEALEDSRRSDSLAEDTFLHMIPDRGLVGEMSAYIGHACYSKVHPLLSTHPDMVPYKIVMDTPGGKEIVGSFLIFPVELKSSRKKALLVRALNIPTGATLEMKRIVEGIFDQMQQLQGDEGIVLIPGLMGARSEFQFIESALNSYLTDDRNTSLSEKFDFNGYDLTDACHVVRG